MQQSEFEKIRYGNIVRGPDGRKYAVTLVLRNKQEKPVHVALTKAIDEFDAMDYELVSSDRIVSYLTAQTINETPSAEAAARAKKK